MNGAPDLLGGNWFLQNDGVKKAEVWFEGLDENQKNRSDKLYKTAADFMDSPYWVKFKGGA